MGGEEAEVKRKFSVTEFVTGTRFRGTAAHPIRRDRRSKTTDHRRA